jgi:hypothetical protein
MFTLSNSEAGSALRNAWDEFSCQVAGAEGWNEKAVEAILFSFKNKIPIAV